LNTKCVPLEAPKYFVSQSNSPTLRVCLSLLQLDVVRWEQPILAMAIASPPTLINLKQIQGYIRATLYCNWGTAAPVFWANCSCMQDNVLAN